MIIQNGLGGDQIKLQKIGSAETFPYFNRVPRVVRIEIWLHCSTPRRVDLREGVKYPADKTGFIDRPCPKARSNLPITAFVNHKSRKWISSHYHQLIQPIATESRWFSPAAKGLQHLFSATRLVKQPSSTLSSNCNVVYFNPEIDDLFLTMDAFRSSSTPQHVLDILQCDEESSGIVDEIECIELYCTGPSGINSHGARVLRILENLESMSIVFGKEPGEHDERRENVVTFDMTQRINIISEMSRHMKITEIFDGNRCIPYYKEKNEKERAKFADQRPYGFVPMLRMSMAIADAPSQPREQEKVFVASKLEVSSSTSEDEQLSVTATSFGDSKPGNDTITDLSSELPSIADSGLSQEASTELKITRAVPAKTFLRFSYLPIELRIKIWRHSFPRQHLILRRESFMKPLSSPFQATFPTCFRRPCDDLPTAFANRESQAEALKHYHVLYQAHYRIRAKESESVHDYYSGATDLLSPHAVYFNPKIDCIALIYSDFLTESSEIHAMFPIYNQKTARCIESIREVKVYHVTLREDRLYYSHKMNRLINMLECFKSLEHIKLIVHPDETSNNTINFDSIIEKDHYNCSIKEMWTGKAKLEFIWGKEDDEGERYFTRT
ncbi:hypothetical protein BHYA_0338g00090 [Botrytis hyacinthi]|uniref:2EXR domain-containing protein n=1 Tax=Botrytis hyacinthi TaxID=278943 RepID=A0A4Z1GE78_9HELO|nr:hypothetical protein BHYA_0338g00090 [Botrytis hyacinthi]